MRTADAVTTRPGLGVHLAATVATYVLLAVVCARLLLQLARRPRGPVEAGERAADPSPAEEART
jgi:hypothetical protein